MMLTEINETIQGQRQGWNLIRKLGEGDAGEVYLVESLLDKQPAIVKRPRRNSFFSDTMRQASQIRQEGSLLHWLQRVSFPNQGLHLGVPALVDQDRSQTDLGEQTFIVIEPARGLNLKMLSQVIRFGSASLETLPSDADSAFLIRQWSQFTEFPAQLLVRILLGVLNLLETVHATEVRTEQGMQSGVLWNDVKPDHLYWHPEGARLTVIDWGNSRYLEKDNITKDRQFTPLDDFRQFLQEMGAFIGEACPELFESLEWPANPNGAYLQSEYIQPLKEKLIAQQEIDLAALKDLRQQEADLYACSKPEPEQLLQFERFQHELAAFGEVPEKYSAASFISAAAYHLVSSNRLAEFQAVCENASRLPTNTTGKWELLRRLAEVAGQSADADGQVSQSFSNALAAGVAEDWSAALWELFNSLGEGTRPEWWEAISQEVRKVALGLEPETISLYTQFARLYYTLKEEVTRLGNQKLRLLSEGNDKEAEALAGFNWQANEELLATFQEEIIRKWKELEPSPPNSGIAYTEVDGLVDPIEALAPGWKLRIERLLMQPKAQADLVMNAWEQKDFELARRGLRSILLWDPDRLRLLTAEKAITDAPQWLSRVRKGASKEEPFYDYLTSVELAGRTLRNRVGGAKWLDQSLEVFKRLRRGSRSVDLLLEYPEVMRELPWLNEYQSREIITLPHTRPIGIERDNPDSSILFASEGVVDGKFGPGEDMAFAEPLDTWIPEARGSSARVFAANFHRNGRPTQSFAIKIMRPDQVGYALPLFIEEVQVLTMLRDVPGVVPMVECGFIKLGEEQSLPNDANRASAQELSGQVVHFGVEQAQNYLAAVDRHLALGWIPYLALERRSAEHNLLRYCDLAYTHGWFLSLRDCLVLSVQICDILQYAHDRNIIYRDHKILHYYWDPYTHGVAMIDWNIAKRQPQGLSDVDKQFDLVQLGARCLHHIFTGRPAQGSLPLGPNRPEEIEKASTHYPVSWTYDDERLPNQLRSILERTLNQGYTQVRDIRQDLLELYNQLPGTSKP